MTLMTRLHALLFITFLLATIAPAELASAQSGAIESEPAATNADAEFEPLLRDFRNLSRSLQARGGISPSDREVIEALRDRVLAFLEQQPRHEAAVGVALQLSAWLGENDAQEEILRQATDRAPENQKFLAFWGRWLMDRGRLAQADEVLQSVDQTVVPHAGLWRAQTLARQNRFEDAIEALDAIPDQVNPNYPGLASRIPELRSRYNELTGKWSAEQAIRETEAAADDLPRVRIVTVRGPIVLELFENQAPEHVANFITLIESGFYDGTKFHRVEPTLIQGGDPNTREGATGVPGTGGPGYRVAGEFRRPDVRSHFAGTLAMARSTDPNSAGSQFYITRDAMPELDGDYTVFGRVLEGMEAVYAIEMDDAIESAEVLRKRDHEYAVTKLPDPNAPIDLRESTDDPPILIQPPGDGGETPGPATGDAPAPAEEQPGESR